MDEYIKAVGDDMLRLLEFRWLRAQQWYDPGSYGHSSLVAAHLSAVAELAHRSSKGGQEARSSRRNLLGMRGPR